MAKPRQVALVTGSAKRLGRALALGLAERGVAAAIHYRGSRAAAEEAVQQARSLGVAAEAFQADLAAVEPAAGLVDRVVAAMGRIDFLVNNASIFDRVGLADTELDLWQQHLAIHMTSPYLLCRSFAARAPAGGAVLNMLDWRALRPTRASFAYTVSKAGLAAMTRSLAQDLAPAVRVNGLAMGAILPPPGEDDFSPEVMRPIPAERPGSLEEVVEAARFLLLGPGYITGEILHLDGGRHLA